MKAHEGTSVWSEEVTATQSFIMKRTTSLFTGVCDISLVISFLCGTSGKHMEKYKQVK